MRQTELRSFCSLLLRAGVSIRSTAPLLADFREIAVQFSTSAAALRTAMKDRARAYWGVHD